MRLQKYREQGKLAASVRSQKAKKRLAIW